MYRILLSSSQTLGLCGFTVLLAACFSPTVPNDASNGTDTHTEETSDSTSADTTAGPSGNVTSDGDNDQTTGGNSSTDGSTAYDDNSSDTGVPTDCEPSTTVCIGDTIIACDDQGNVTSVDTCNLGCADRGSGPICLSLVPSFGVSAPSGQTEDLVIDGGSNSSIDISGCGESPARVSVSVSGETTDYLGAPHVARVTQGGGAPPICIFRFRDVLIETNTTVVNDETAGHALSLQAQRDFELNGTLTFRTAGSGPSPGANVLASSTTFTSPDGTVRRSPGAGGGGNGTAGGNGGICTSNCGDLTVAQSTGGTGGQARGTDRLYAGSRGGNVTIKNSTNLSARGGRGGGGLHVVALESATIGATGRIQAGGLGGTGGGGYCIVGGECIPASGSAGGGGSGGTVVIEAPSIAVNASILAANGAGGAGGCRTLVFSVYWGVSGMDGVLGDETADGGVCGGAGNGGVATPGALASTRAGFNADSSGYPCAGAGAGGDGQFLLRARTVNDISTAGAVISPTPQLGTVDTAG